MINIKKFLNENADIRYAAFNKKFITTKYPIFGVRIPRLRKFSKEIEPEYIELDSHLTHEEILLYVFSAGNIKSEDEQLEYLSNILPYIDNWCTSDSVPSSMKMLSGSKSYKFLTKLVDSDKEFDARVGIVTLMRNFLETERLDDVLMHLRQVKNEAFYVKMALAWFYAELCAYDFEKAKREISNVKDKFTRNKAISKAHDSFRVTKEQKEELEKLRIK